MKTICNYCKKVVHKTPSQYRKFKRHFCNKDCYYNFRKANPRMCVSKTKDVFSLRKIKEFARMRSEILSNY